MAADGLYCSTTRNVLGEGPVWDVETQSLFTLDCMSRKMYRHKTGEEAQEEWALPRTPGSFALRQGRGGMLMAYRRGLALIDAATGALEDITTPDIDFEIEIFNDGKCDRRGRFWIGTMDRQIAQPVGHLYRVDPDLTVHAMDGGITLANGIAWSPDNRTMYFCDSRPGHIWAYDYDISAGTVTNRRMFVDFATRSGRPDGCTVDADGGLWVAEISAGQIVRFAPDGTEAATLRTPMSKPTSVMFGGPDLRTLFVTSMRYGLNEAALADEPQAGCTITVRPGVAGLPEPRFGG